MRPGCQDGERLVSARGAWILKSNAGEATIGCGIDEQQFCDDWLGKIVSGMFEVQGKTEETW